MADGPARSYDSQEAKETNSSRIQGWLTDSWRALAQPVDGQSLVEYAMIILFVAIACMVALVAMAGAIANLWAIITDVLLPTLG
ncbi:MAG TPA: hypothetical protein PK691_10115 [Thermomicrobiales bacterium]|nr:hypothetical protein [Thermomicrobiales bacterium]HRA46988.1 hypothetical protein [Thermomicrobiales bacterium]